MILGVESSCDDSSLALFTPKEGILGDWVHRQLLHSEYGGVVPALASREHLQNFTPMLQLLQERLGERKVSRIAVTCGPGLAGCLALGISLAKALSVAWGVPLSGVNHLRGHAFSPFIGLHKEDASNFEERFSALLPHLGLIVSGGNTILFKINKNRRLEILAQTVDDAAGEALDKGAKLLGMPYPGGALIEAQAEAGDSAFYNFPKAFPGREDMRFSFSGLKTSLRYLLEKMSDETVEIHMPDICASYQKAVIEALVRKVKQASNMGSYKSFGLSGGVANNKLLRARFESVARKAGVPSFIAKPEHTGDNAAMIAFAAYADPSGLVSSKDFGLSFNPSFALA